MKKITYNDYFSKVYGCWIGKCVAGNIGAPYEGMKQKLNLSYSPAYIEKMLPNDDLDLQVLWLEVLRKKGEHFTAEDLAEIFVKNCDYAPGEYAFFKKNHRRGIPTPYAGTFNNEYYTDGMGAPIRSEIWACICPGNPKLAVKYATMDATIDHLENSCAVNGERFLAALESMAFFESDIEKLILSALGFVDKNCRLYSLITDVLSWSNQFDFDVIREKIIREYGNVEATDCLQNIGFILMGLLLGNMDFIATTMSVINCGFDTDCTAATLGAILGIILGAEKLVELLGVAEIRFKLGVRSEFESDDVYVLAQETCRVGVYFSQNVNQEVSIENFNGKALQIEYVPETILLKIIYEGEPAIGFGESKQVTVELFNQGKETKTVKLDASFDAPLIVALDKTSVTIPAGETQRVSLCVTAKEAERLPDGNKVKLTLSYDTEKVEKIIGFAGKARWKIYGPFWKNIVTVPPLEEGESYWKYFASPTEEQLMDKIRHYHMNSLPDLSVQLSELNSLEAKTVDIDIDEVRLGNYERFNGQAAYWLETAFYSEKEEIGGIQIGYQDSFAFYLNGKLLAEREGGNMYTPENVHLFKVKVHKGINRIFVKLVKRQKDIKFSYNLLSDGVTSDHLLLDHVNI